MSSLLTNYTPKGRELQIQTYPAPILKKKAIEVTEFDEELEELCRNMLYTMYEAPGIGLAAPQVGISKRIFVMDIDYDREEITDAKGETKDKLTNFNPLIFINPIIKNTSGEILYEEGCLSVPGVYEEVKRFESIQVDYQDLEGREHSIQAQELLAICIQHENDHLDGIVFIEKLSNLKFNFYKKKLIKQKRN